MQKIVVGIGGSSGAIYAKVLLDKLARYQQQHPLQVGVVMSANAHENWRLEIGVFDKSAYPFVFYAPHDFNAPFASGSARYMTMIICPSSMGLLARIAQGVSQDLLTRAADVILKERRRLIIVPREAPYNLIHLQNMTLLTQAGAIVCPATPSFYSRPTTLEEIAATVVDRVLDLAGVFTPTFRWHDGDSAA